MPARTEPYFEYFKDIGLYVPRPAATLPATTTVTHYTVTGVVLVVGWILEVTTAIQAQANAVKGRHTPTGGTIGDVSGTFDVNGMAVGDFVVFQGPTTAGALTQAPTSMKTSAGGSTGNTLLRGTGGMLLMAGALALNTAATNTGAQKDHLFFIPILPGSKIVAA